MDSVVSKKYWAAMVFVAIGGYLEAYTYVTRDGVFANVQTGNIARTAISFAKGDYRMMARYLVPVLVFVAGVSLSIQLKRFIGRRARPAVSFAQVIVFTEILLVFLVGLIPGNRLDILATTGVSLICAIQVQSFRHFDNNAFSSTMRTGNLRCATENLNRYFATKERNNLYIALKYGGSDAVFAVFAAVGYKVTARFVTLAVWWCLLPLGILLVVFSTEHIRQLNSAAQ